MDKTVDAMDRISELPSSIIHHVTSFLSAKQAARTNVLSRRWNQIRGFIPYLGNWWSLWLHHYTRRLECCKFFLLLDQGGSESEQPVVEKHLNVLNLLRASQVGSSEVDSSLEIMTMNIFIERYSCVLVWSRSCVSKFEKVNSACGGSRTF